MIEMKNEAVMSLNIPCRQIHFAEHSCGERARARAPFSRPSPSELLRGATPAAQLKGRGISTSEVKGSLADALAAAREAAPSSTPAVASTTAAAGGGTVPLVMLAMQGVESRGADVAMKAAPGMYAAVRCATDGGEMLLLVDTACSGLVLRPAAAQRLGLQVRAVPSATMTAAGGTAAAPDVAMLASLRLVGGEQTIEQAGQYAAVQDIGALPTKLDGIVGLSVLERFAAVDIVREPPSLVCHASAPPAPAGERAAARAPLTRTPLGVFTADTFLNGARAPLIVDTGATATVLDWDGARAHMGLTPDKPGVRPARDAAGVMGADGVALALTHRAKVSGIALGAREGNLLDEARREVLEIDIGNLPVLAPFKQAAGEGGKPSVAGVLGSDVLLRCATLRFDFQRSELLMYK